MSGNWAQEDISTKGGWVSETFAKKVEKWSEISKVWKVTGFRPPPVQCDFFYGFPNKTLTILGHSGVNQLGGVFVSGEENIQKSP